MVIYPATCGYLCAWIVDFNALRNEEGYKLLQMEIEVKTRNGLTVTTTRCPIRVDGSFLVCAVGAPLLGEHNDQFIEEFELRVKTFSQPVNYSAHADQGN